MSSSHIPAKKLEDANIEGMAERAFDVDLPSTPGLAAAIRASVERTSGLYFFEDVLSRAGFIADKDAMPEEKIAGFIRDNNSALYEKLDAMPVESCDLPVDPSEDDQHDGFDSLSSSGDSRRESIKGLASRKDLVPTNRTEKIPDKQGKPQTEFAEEAEDVDVDCPNEVDTDQPLQAQGQLCLPNNFKVPVYHNCQPGALYYCESPSCELLENVIPQGGYFTKVNGAHWCLDCARNS